MAVCTESPNLIPRGILIILALYCSSISYATPQSNHDEFHEDLYLRPLSDGKLFAHFKFTSTYRKDIKNLKWENHFEIFPLSVAELMATTDLKELQFSLTKGNWNYKNWGYPVRSSPPGAQILAKFSQHKDPGKYWQRLINSLAGKFCTSLVSADNKATTELSLGDTPSESINEKSFYAHLPEETFCTENLTPWKKLLPCYSDSGLASLLNAVNLLQSSHSSLAIDVRTINTHVQSVQSISVVFNPLVQSEGKQTWSLAKIFGTSVKGRCHVAAHSRVHVDITDLDDKKKLYPQTHKEYSSSHRQYAIFDATTTHNLGIKQTQILKRPAFSTRPKIPIDVQTHIAGLGTFEGTIVSTVINNLNDAVRVTYTDIVPYYLRVFLHTLTIRTSGHDLKPDKFDLALSEKDAPTLIQFSLLLPPNSQVQISYDFVRAFLRWTEFKTDANKGVLMGSQPNQQPSDGYDGQTSGHADGSHF